MSNKLDLKAKIVILDCMGRELLIQHLKQLLSSGGGLTNASPQRLLYPEPPLAFFILKEVYGKSATR